MTSNTTSIKSRVKYFNDDHNYIWFSAELNATISTAQEAVFVYW